MRAVSSDFWMRRLTWALLGPEEHLEWSQKYRKLDRAVLSALIQTNWCIQRSQVTGILSGCTTQSTRLSESHMDLNITLQELCVCTVIFYDAQRKYRFGCELEILFLIKCLITSCTFQKHIQKCINLFNKFMQNSGLNVLCPHKTLFYSM